MAIRSTESDGTVFLECDECPPKPDYSAAYMNWSKSCKHIELAIQNRFDSGTLLGNTRYQFCLSPLGSFLCRDMWALWATVTLGESDPELGGLMSVSFEYESDYYRRTKAHIGYIMPEDGRESIRVMLWDWITSELFKTQPTADIALVCPQRNHSSLLQVEFVKDLSSQDGINAQIACIVLESCCTYCYRETMGQDVEDAGSNFGMAGVTAPRQNNSNFKPPVPPSPAPSSAMPVSQPPRQGPQVVGRPSNRDPNAAKPPWER